MRAHQDTTTFDERSDSALPIRFRTYLRQAVIIGRWVLLGLLCVQLVAILLAVLVKKLLKLQSYEEFRDSVARYPGSDVESGKARDPVVESAKDRAVGLVHAKFHRGQPASPSRPADFRIASAGVERSELLSLDAPGQSLSHTSPRSPGG